MSVPYFRVYFLGNALRNFWPLKICVVCVDDNHSVQHYIHCLVVVVVVVGGGGGFRGTTNHSATTS